MPDLLYVGPLGAVRLTLPTGLEVVVNHGELFTATPDHAASLLDQPSNWQAAPAPTKTTTKTTTPAKPDEE